jgi:hypothetical protein
MPVVASHRPNALAQGEYAPPLFSHGPTPELLLPAYRNLHPFGF